MNTRDESNFNSPLGVGGYLNSPLGVGGYKYVFLDLDDTIWDFHANARAVLEEIFEEQNLIRHFINFDEYFGIYKKRNLELWDQYGKGQVTKEFLNVERFRHPLVQKGIDDIKMAERTGVQFLDMLPTKNTLIPFAKELLDYLSAKYPLTIVSNGFVEVQYKKLRNCKLENYFSHVVLSESAGALKPDKRIFEHALELNGAEASETIMIGDSYEADIVGAGNAGIVSLWYNPNQKNETENQLTPLTRQISKLEQIIEIL